MATVDLKANHIYVLRNGYQNVIFAHQDLKFVTFAFVLIRGGFDVLAKKMGYVFGNPTYLVKVDEELTIFKTNTDFYFSKSPKPQSSKDRNLYYPHKIVDKIHWAEFLDHIQFYFPPDAEAYFRRKYPNIPKGPISHIEYLISYLNMFIDFTMDLELQHIVRNDNVVEQ